MLGEVSIHNRKVVIIGAGNVGASIAYALTIRNLAREIIDKIIKWRVHLSFIICLV